ncbi:MAG: ABC transporter ATP-binding protein [Bacteroidales bacterium]|jgi:ABC-2 type transport system ATP-binding protein|nr:ABC transporter ATP-binding protein [Bacteroidales bacterium]
MITLENLNFGYTKQKVLFKELNLALSADHIYGLLGKNGAGKTTLLKIMSGLLFAKEGKVETLGYNSAYRHAEMLCDIYFLTEEMYIPSMKIKNYVKAYAPFYRNFNHEQFEHYLQEFSIESQQVNMQKLSHGQKKEVLISFALAANTKILLLDEPTNGLDIPSKSIFRRLMASVVDKSRLVIISTHQVRDLHSLIDAIVILDNGKILLNSSTEEITQKLTFKTVDKKPEEDETILYSEDNIRGCLLVAENKHNEVSNLDLELLFNASIANKQKINEIFNNK